MEPLKLKDGKIVRSENPLNLETPFDALDGFLTDTSAFYVRSHFPIPAVDRNGWRLRVEGEVEHALELSYDQLLRLDSRTILVTLECAGNGRSLLTTKVKGVQWGLGAVGTARWTGVSLAQILELATPRCGACEVILEGADEGLVDDEKAPRGNVRFARSIPLKKALADVVLAYRMNGVELPPQHGFPVRAIVPGWYAVASIKWLRRIIVTDDAFNGYYQTLDYAFWTRAGDNAQLVPLRELQVKAQIARPVQRETLPPNAPVRVHGAAWAGAGARIVKVELTTDGGETWSETRLGESAPNAWCLWDYTWQTPAQPGEHILMARATDSLGQVQPSYRDPDRGTYMINHLLPVRVHT